MTNQLNIELQGYDLTRIYQQGSVHKDSKPDVFVQFGCSWSRAWGSSSDEAYPFDQSYTENTEFLSRYSYMALLADHLGIPNRINFSLSGSNNDTQSRLMVEFVERNRHKFRRVFISWGITSIYRWELFCNRIDAPWDYMQGTNPKHESAKEMEYYFKHHWDKGWQLQLLSNKILTLSSYLDKNNVEHLFFPVFQPYNRHNMLLNTLHDSVLFEIDQDNNDMLSLMCQHEGIDSPNDFMADPIYPDQRVDLLIKKNYLSQKHAHPTQKGHEFIAKELVRYYNMFNK